MARKTKAEALKTRQKLLVAAQGLFSKQGIADTRLEDIAQKAGVTRGAFYWHFKNKQEILIALNDSLNLPMVSLAESLDENFDQSPVITLQQHIHALFSQITESKKMLAELTLIYHQCEFSRHGELMKQHQISSRIGSVDRIQRELEWAKALDQIQPQVNCQAAAVAIHALIDGLLYQWSADAKSFNLGIALAAVDLLLHGLIKSKTS